MTHVAAKNLELRDEFVFASFVLRDSVPGGRQTVADDDSHRFMFRLFLSPGGTEPQLTPMRLARIGSTQQNTAAYLQATPAVESSGNP